mmetsp:Transcript_5279/g.12412  ORF Transcript_5279/g.12412 Transcript_5279/m.12412 type:complete len:411 (-) Transcript_5279:988-2220(-)
MGPSLPITHALPLFPLMGVSGAGPHMKIYCLPPMHLHSSAHSPAVRDAREVQVFCPLLLDVLRGEGARAQRLLRLIHWSPARDADDECCLVWGASASSDAESSIPSPVDALTGVLEVQLDTLVHKASIARHHHRPSGVAGGHGRDIEALLPLLVDPLEGEGVGHLVGLLGVWRALGHDHECAATQRPCHGCDVVALLPLLHDPLLGQELLNQRVHLRSELGAGIHDERPQVLAARHTADEQPIFIALLHVLVHSAVGHVVVVALLHGPVRVVHRDPLCGRQPQAHPLAWRIIIHQVALCFTRPLLAHFDGPVCEDGPADGRPTQGFKQAHARVVLGLLIEFQVEHALRKLSKCWRSVAAQHLSRGPHLLLANQVALVITLVPLPRQPALQQEQQRVRQGLKVVSSAGRAP